MVAAASCLLAAGRVTAADLFRDVEEAYAFRELRRTPFDSRATEDWDAAEVRFLEDLFGLTDEAALLNTDVSRWLLSEGARGLHAADYLERMDALRGRLDALSTPRRIASVRALVSECLALQRAFVADWYGALEQGREFESQMTDEVAYHEGLHRSHRLLLKAFAELRALFPDAGASTRTAFHDHLRAVSFR